VKRVARFVVFLGLCAWGPAPAQQEPVPTFGTTVVIPSGLRGEIYYIRAGSDRLPNLKKLKKPKGIIYTESLNVPPQDWLAGFPGVTKRFEWFAINYTGKFWIEKPGEYRFSLTSDDGAQLYIDDRLIIDNDGLHAPNTLEGMAALAGGIHELHVPYFQGPRSAIALVLKIAGPDEDLRIFSTEEFKPPPNPADWKFPAN
jgi:PA14 domain